MCFMPYGRVPAGMFLKGTNFPFWYSSKYAKESRDVVPMEKEQVDIKPQIRTEGK